MRRVRPEIARGRYVIGRLSCILDSLLPDLLDLIFEPCDFLKRLIEFLAGVLDLRMSGVADRLDARAVRYPKRCARSRRTICWRGPRLRWDSGCRGRVIDPMLLAPAAQVLAMVV